MATVDADLKTYLQSDSAISAKVGTRIHENYVPETPVVPFIWYVRADDGDEQFDCLDDAIGDPPDKVIFDLECCGRNIKEAAALATLVRTRCHKAVKATFGSRTATLFCQNQKDDYVKINAAERIFTSDMQLEVFP